MNAIALPTKLSDIIEEYEEKRANIDAVIKSFKEAVSSTKMACSIGGAYAGSLFDRGEPYLDERRMQKLLLTSAWSHLYSRLQIERLASAKDKQKWERTLENPPPLTVENAKALLGDYLLNARFHLLRGLAEVFSDLDPAYKSHTKVKIGVAGLPKRVILTSVGSYGSYGRDKLRDILNALAAYQQKPLVEHEEFKELDKLCGGLGGHKAGEVDFAGFTVKSKRGDETIEITYPNRGVRVRKFQNGNAHVFFDKETLLDINRALAEFYGDVLPDVDDPNAKHAPGTAVAKDLQYYPTPQSVIEQMLNEIGLYGRDAFGDDRLFVPKYVLEPSCGDGRILDELKRRGHAVLGVEYHAGRAAEARAKGHPVMIKNFLEVAPTGDFDFVAMNPPFYGKHYIKHVQHALKFLKPNGFLVTVLPASAYDDGELKGRWIDLPIASFRESGTNISTGLLVMRNN